MAHLTPRRETRAAWKQKPVIGAIAVLLILFAWVRLGCWGTSGKRAASAARGREMAYANAQMLCLGRYLAENHAGHKVLVLTYPAPSDYLKKRNKAMVDSLSEGLEGALTLAGQESPAPPDGSGPMVSAMMDINKPENLDAMIERHPDCDMIVSLISLPHNYKEMKFWKTPDRARPKLVLADANIAIMEELLKKGRVVAAVVRKPGQGYDVGEKLPKDPIELFNQRYILVDAKNIDQVLSGF